MSTIFISYRRQDGISYALRDIKTRLESTFGPGSVFFDLDIALGVNFADHIREHIEKSSVVLAFIGENWLGSSSDGRRRIDEENDFVRIELALAFRECKTVIPVFTGAAGPSLLDQLPEPLSALRFLNGMEMRAGAMYSYQFDLLTMRLAEALGRLPPAAPRRRTRSSPDLEMAREIYRTSPSDRVYDLVSRIAAAYHVDRTKAYQILYKVRQQSTRSEIPDTRVGAPRSDTAGHDVIQVDTNAELSESETMAVSTSRKLDPWITGAFGANYALGGPRCARASSVKAKLSTR